METRTIKELLQVLLDSEVYFKSGLCNVVDKIDPLPANEHSYLVDYLLENLPAPKYPHPSDYEPIYSFPYGEWPPRKEWLEQEINKL